MGVLSEGNVRVSLPPGTTDADVDALPRGAARRWCAGCGSSWARPRPARSAPRCRGPQRRIRDPEKAAEVPDCVVDALGRRCPIPVIELAKVIGDVPVGGTVTVLSDDEAARLDIPAWCEMRGQEYVGEREAAQGRAYLVRRLG